ncbi:MAG: undecaprenyl-diphosphate phosphatase, partial [Vulcanimicrobiaceae bacterium]
GIAQAFAASIIRGRFSGTTDEKTAWLLVTGTIPVGLLGLFFEREVRGLFASPIPVALFLAANGLVMFAGERLKRKDDAKRTLDSLSFADGVKVGFAEALALLPGISRSGTAMVASLLMNLSEPEAARFSFLLGTPVILAAGLLEVPRLFDPTAHVALVESVAGGLLSAITAYISLAFLTRYFRSNDLRPFGWYCLAAGVICFILFFSGMVKA